MQYKGPTFLKVGTPNTLLKAHKKSIRRATVNTFGYIAKAIGPHDVLATLLNNLKVQERQLRVCTTIAIAIVAETCSPFTVSDIMIAFSRFWVKIPGIVSFLDNPVNSERNFNV